MQHKNSELEPKIMQKVGDRDNPSISIKDTAFTINVNPMSDRQQVVLEPQVLTPKRTEEGKKMRKDYESGKIKAQRKYMQQLEPREDGVSNTLTSVQKDNYVAEPDGIAVAERGREKVSIPCNTKEGSIECELGGVIDISYPSSTTRRGRVQDGGTDSPAVTCGVEHTHARIEPSIMQYPHGWNEGREITDGTCPSITTSSWEHNNVLKFKGMELHEGDGLYTGASEAF